MTAKVGERSRKVKEDEKLEEIVRNDYEFEWGKMKSLMGEKSGLNGKNVRGEIDEQQNRHKYIDNFKRRTQK